MSFNVNMINKSKSEYEIPSSYSPYYGSTTGYYNGPSITGESPTTAGYDVCITGVSGRLPGGENIHEWSKYLYPTTETPEYKTNFGPYYKGEDKSFESLDYGRSFEQVVVEPIMDSLVKVTLEAVRDAGLTSTQFKGTKTGVFIGKWGEKKSTTGYYFPETTPTSHVYYAGQLAKYFEFTGPYQMFETPTTTPQGFVALDYAINAIKTGVCEQAIVGGISYGNVDGVIIIQKRQEYDDTTKGYYTKVLHSKVQYVETLVGGGDFEKFVRDVYADGKLDANKIAYLETAYYPQQYETKTLVVDGGSSVLPEFTIAEALGKLRTTQTPFQMGSTRWNYGKYESPNGFYNLVKMLLGMRYGMVAGNVYFTPSLYKTTTWQQKYKVAETSQRLDDDGLWAFSSYGSAFVHFVFEPYYFEKKTNVTGPYFFGAGYETVFDGLKKIVDEKKTAPIWFFFSGMDASLEWREMMHLEAFRLSFNKSVEYLKPFGFDLEKSFEQKYLYKSVIHAAIQIAMFHVLKEFGIEADQIVGYSGDGELVAAYVDGALTQEQVILAAYYKGKLFEEETAFSYRFKTALVGGLPSVEEFVAFVAKVPSVVITHYNSKDIVTITGPLYEMDKLMRDVKEVYAGVFVKDIIFETTPTLPFHTAYMRNSSVLSKYRYELEKIIGTPKLRSFKWLSTSSPQQQQYEYTKYASAEYFVNNLTCPVYFYDIVKRMPENAIAIEFSASQDGFLKPFIVKTFSPSSKYVSLMKMFNKDSRGKYDFEFEKYKQQAYYKEAGDYKSIYERKFNSITETKKYNELVNYLPYFEKRDDYSQVGVVEDKYYFDNFDKYMVQVKYYLTKVLAKFEKYEFKNYSPSSTQEQFKYGGKFLDLLKEIVQFEKYKFTDEWILQKAWQQDEFIHYARDNYLKSIFEIVHENNTPFNKTFKVLEVAPASHFFGPSKIAFPTDTRFEYYYAPIGEFNEKLWNELKYKEEYSMHLVDWDFEKMVDFPLYQKYKDFDLVIFNGAVASLTPYYNKEKEEYVRKWLVSIMEKILKPQGFFFVHEYTNVQVLDTLKYMNRVEKYLRPSSAYAGVETNKSYENSSDDWKKFYEQFGYYPVSFKIDEKFTSFDLYRKPYYFGGASSSSYYVQPTIKPTQYEVYMQDEETTYNWMDKLKYALNETKYERIWLISQKLPTSSIMDLIKHLRESEPRGDRLRFIFKTPSTYESLNYDEIKGGDLLWNVYKYGKWGSYRQESFVSVDNFKTSLSPPFSPYFTYVLVNGTQEFGLEFAYYMAKNGARKFLFTTKYAIQSEYQEKMLKTLEREFTSIRIRITPYDVKHELECQEMLKEAKYLSEEKRIAGIFYFGHEEDTWESKYYGLMNLDKYTRDIDYFVVFYNSFFDGYKQQQQQQQQDSSNWSVIDQLFEQRRKSGKSAIVIKTTDFEELFKKDGLKSFYENKFNQNKFYENKFYENKVYENKVYENKFYENKVDETTTKWFPSYYKEASSSVYDKYTTVMPTEKYNYLMPKKVFEKLNQVDIQPAFPPVFIIHPIEGHVNMLKDFGKYVKYPVYGLQFTQDAFKYDTIEELAEYYWSCIMKEFPFIERVHLCGVSFGASVAFEMATKRPLKVLSLSLLDATYNKSYDGMITKPDMDIEWLYQFVTQYGQVADSKKFFYTLGKFGNVDERVKYAVKELMTTPPRFNLHPFDIELAAKAYVKKMQMSYLYEPKYPLRLAELLVITPIETIKYDSFLKYFAGNVIYKTVYCDKRELFESARGEQVAKYFNEYLTKATY